MDLTLARLSSHRAVEAAALLTDAFADDPLAVFYYPHRYRRSVVLRALFEASIGQYLAYGHVYAALLQDRIVGVSVWRPPELPNRSAPDNAPGVARTGLLLNQLRAFWLVYLLFPRTAAEASRGFAKSQSMHPTTPHWYLFLAAVEIGMRGRGIGSDLLTPVHKLADDTKTPCYLETASPRTQSFYDRVGYVVTKQFQPSLGSPLVAIMTRAPRCPDRRQPVRRTQPVSAR